MDTDIDHLLRDAAPAVSLPEELASTVVLLASEIAEQKPASASLRRRVIISTVGIASAASAIAIGGLALGHPDGSGPPAVHGDSYEAQLKLVAAEAPADLSLPPGVTPNDAAAAVLHKITVDPTYQREPGLRTVADVYRRYAQCQAFVFKPAMGTTVNGITVTPTNPTPGGPATLIEPADGKDRVPPGFVRIQCKDGLADPPKTKK